MLPKLSLNSEFRASYCIPMWLRDEHIRRALKRDVKRLQLCEEIRTDPVAVVGFGPTLIDTWQEIKKFKYVISCSGSHKFLIERGIIPTWHVEVDPRPHKVRLIGEPHRDVQYLIASCCSPVLFDHLKDFNVLLWHVFDMTDEGIRLIPAGDWAIMGGCDVGLRAITNAAFMGFRDLHVFGIDGCEKNGERHAAEHPNERSPLCVTEFEGREFVTTGGLALAAKQLFHELSTIPKVKVTFYGDGLVQAMAKNFTPSESVPEDKRNLIAGTRPVLISREYTEQNRILHETNEDYGAFAARRADFIAQWVELVGARTVLDYGCGKGSLARALPFPIWEYDPAVPGKEEPPRPAEFVCCLDVLEHIEPDRLVFVLRDLQRCVKASGYFVVATAPSSKFLPDGRNAHVSLHDGVWWTKVIGEFFHIEREFALLDGQEMHYIVTKKGVVTKLEEPPKKSMLGWLKKVVGVREAA